MHADTVAAVLTLLSVVTELYAAMQSSNVAIFAVASVCTCLASRRSHFVATTAAATISK
jgi:hypothetical protein